MARISISDGTSQRVVELVDSITIVGRSSENKIAIEDKQASRRHCQFERTEFGFKLVDLESRNGTRVNDRVVNQALLKPGDRVQIGKHVLTFEDPGWKEPPSDIAARFAPPPAVSPAATVPATAASTPPPVSAPVAVVQVAPPLPPPASPVPVESASEAEARNRRRSQTARSSATERIEVFERQKEQQTLKMVGIAAAIFILGVAVLILVSGSPLAGTGTKSGGADPRRSGSAADQETREFDALADLAEKGRSDGKGLDDLERMCEAFKAKYPKSPSLLKVEGFLAVVSGGRREARSREMDEGLRAAEGEAKKGDFGGALRRIRALLDKYGSAVGLRETILKTHDEVYDKAKAHYQAKVAQAQEFAAKGEKLDAHRVYEALLLAMGGGSVDELGDFCRVIRTSLEGLK